MPTFTYILLDRSGKKIKGEIKSDDYASAAEALKKQNKIIFSLKEKKGETYQKWLKVQPSKVKEAHNLLFTPARIEFNPRVAGGYTTEVTTDGQEIIAVNSHSMPPWRTEEKKSPVLPKEFVELMEHLFPEEECREYLYNWIY